MAGVYGGFTSSAEFIDGAQRISSFHCYTPKNFNFAMLLATINLSFLHERWSSRSGWQAQLPLFGHRFYNIIQLYINAIVTRIMIEIKT
jgi:hypothetical protein